MNLQTSANGTLALLYPRSSAALSVYYFRLVPAPNSTATPGGTGYTNTEQLGASVTAGYQLSRTLALSGLVAWSETQSLDSAADKDRSTQSSYRLALIQQISQRTAASIGVRWETLGTTLRSTDATEFAVFLGALHRF